MLHHVHVDCLSSCYKLLVIITIRHIISEKNSLIAATSLYTLFRDLLSTSLISGYVASHSHVSYSSRTSSTSWVKPDLSSLPVLTTPHLSISIISASPTGRCLTPIGTTKSSPFSSSTFSTPSFLSIWIVREPLMTVKVQTRQQSSNI